MKKLILFAFLVFSSVSFAQQIVGNDTIYKIEELDVKPEFPGGMTAFFKYVGRNFQVPEDSEFSGGKLVVSFVINESGNLTEINVINDLGFGTKEEAVRVLKKSPKWIPGEKNGQKVRVFHTLPILLGRG